MFALGICSLLQSIRTPKLSVCVHYGLHMTHGDSIRSVKFRLLRGIHRLERIGLE